MNKSKSVILTSIIIGSLALLSTGANAELLYSEDFEKQLPGKHPAQWKRAWGTPETDSVSVTNERASSGERSMLLERFEHKNHWGMAMRLPKIKAGKWTLEYMFLYEGKGNAASLGFELRDAKNSSQRLLIWSIKKSRIEAYSKKRGAKKAWFRGGNILPERWYKMRITFPLTPADGDTAHLEWQEMPKGEKQSCEIDMFYPKGEFGLLFINWPKTKTNFRFFLDDFKLSQSKPKK